MNGQHRAAQVNIQPRRTYLQYIWETIWTTGAGVMAASLATLSERDPLPVVIQSRNGVQDARPTPAASPVQSTVSWLTPGPMGGVLSGGSSELIPGSAMCKN